MSKQMTIRCHISGKVQGVWFRAATKTQADKLNLTGWAKNLPDGRVEVIACGDAAAIKQLHEWLKQGPELAIVTELTYEEVPWQKCDEFNVK